MINRLHSNPSLKPKSQRERRGAAVVEFAIIAPLLFTLTFGMIEFGRTMLVQQVLTNASREGVRRAVMGSASVDDVTAVVQEYTTGGSVNGATVMIEPSPPSSAAAGDPITVTVTIPFADVSWLPAPWFMDGITLTASSTMRRESMN